MDFEGNGIGIGTAVVCRENGYGQCCDFIASDQLKDGKVEIYYCAPAASNQWKEVVNTDRRGFGFGVRIVDCIKINR